MEKKPKACILAIETSCDETAISVLSLTADLAHPEKPCFETLSHEVHTQAALHAEFGGVFPNLAKREHDKNFVPVLMASLTHAFGITVQTEQEYPNLNAEQISKIESLLAREQTLAPQLIRFIQSLDPADLERIKSELTGIAVTYGPGLEPALWVGISATKALAHILDIPIFPINHMEGHIASVLGSTAIQDISFPALALLISGGHTELVLIESWHAYILLGQTVDDAVGEAYDKVARVLGLPYPGGPAISKLAQQFRDQKSDHNIFALPRPMIHSKDLQFSFSGLKTAVLYAVKKLLQDEQKTELTDNQKIQLAAEFEQAVVEVLISKTSKTIQEYNIKSLIIGGGVIANTFIRQNFKALCDNLETHLSVPEMNLTTDNASMIGLVALMQILDGQKGILPSESESIVAQGNLSFSSL